MREWTVSGPGVDLGLVVDDQEVSVLQDNGRFLFAADIDQFLVRLSRFVCLELGPTMIRKRKDRLMEQDFFPQRLVRQLVGFRRMDAIEGFLQGIKTFSGQSRDDVVLFNELGRAIRIRSHTEKENERGCNVMKGHLGMKSERE